MSRRIAVLAGTPVDTEMGADFFSGYGYDIISGITASDPKEQSYLQMFDRDKLYKITRSLIFDFASEGAEAAVVYCNSLSCALELERLRNECTIPIITPLEAYEVIVKNYDFVGILAANGQSLHRLEEICINSKPEIKLMGASILPVVEAIEKQMPPRGIVYDNGIAKLANGFSDAGAQCIILGCTHFPYFSEELSSYLQIPVLNPAAAMMDMLRRKIG
ncbi:Glutamate racemase [bioreactor metagenome]|uniref:Glutamate racemase n=1 Tax=bioreactor metagenome TaxID=1076179 RepID=A0A645B458_9ZZZZ|nr:aspartate/glutamate racemase family protein [Candidatus Metalachnospira sp.]